MARPHAQHRGRAELGLIQRAAIVVRGNERGDHVIAGVGPPPRDEITEVLNTLGPREATVLKMRFGLIDGRQKTLEEVGKYLNVTRERVRQIEVKALRKLRHPTRSKHLKTLMNYLNK